MENKENKTNKEYIDRIKLYERFLGDYWTRLSIECKHTYFNTLDDLYHTNPSNDLYYKTFPMLATRGLSSKADAIVLVDWIEKENNGIVPEHIQIMLNEFILRSL